MCLDSCLFLIAYHLFSHTLSLFLLLCFYFLFSLSLSLLPPLSPTELSTQRVWDYFGDTYVHRLIQGKEGEIVPIEGEGEGEGEREKGEEGGGGIGGEKKNHTFTKGKISAIIGEYNMLLTSQLEAQREYYEKRERVLTSQLAKNMNTMAHTHGKGERKRERREKEQLEGEREKEREGEERGRERERGEGEREREREMDKSELIVMIASLSEEVEALKKECHKLQREKRRAEERGEGEREEIKFLREVNESMRANQEAILTEIRKVEAKRESDSKEKDQKIQDLEEQVRDLSFFIEAQKTIGGERGESELRDGDVVVVPKVPHPHSASSHRGRRGKKR